MSMPLIAYVSPLFTKHMEYYVCSAGNIPPVVNHITRGLRNGGVALARLSLLMLLLVLFIHIPEQSYAHYVMGVFCCVLKGLGDQP